MFYAVGAEFRVEFVGVTGVITDQILRGFGDQLGLASPLGPVRRFNLAHPKILIP
jgi:hypothetical protein